jgi:hypothetical protein
MAIYTLFRIGSCRPLHILVDPQARRNPACRFFLFLGQYNRPCLEFLRVNTPFCTFLSQSLSLLLFYFTLVFMSTRWGKGQ